MFPVGAEVILRMKCVSCLVYCSIGRSLEGLGFVLGQWELAKTPGIVLGPTGCGKSYYLFMPNTLQPLYEGILLCTEPDIFPDDVGRNQHCLWKDGSVHVPNCESLLVTEAKRKHV
jgi:hypothetical protein